jgi:hypothetical protein
MQFDNRLGYRKIRIDPAFIPIFGGMSDEMRAD